MAELGRIGPYRLIRLLGTGGMGEVFLAHDERLDRKVAIKRLRPSSDVATGHRERFRREARIAARLKHPAIVQIHDVVREDEVDCIVMEYVEGEDLRRRMDAAPLGLHDALAIARQIALAMAEAHDQGIIHRDLKSENVLVTQAGEVKITDFGIAKDLRDETLTADGHVIGTYRAMSPEQALGRPLDHRSDLFSFGVLLYEALTGTSPFRAETPFLTLQRVVHGEIPPLRRLRPALPAALSALVEQLLQKDPLLRPRDFHEVADALAEIQGEAPARPCSGPKPRHRPPPDYDGDTLGAEDPVPTPASGDAPVASGEPDGTRTPAASPAARRDAHAVLAMAATAPSDQPMLRAPVDAAAATAPAAPARIAKPGDRAVSAEAPDARPVQARRLTRRIAVLAVVGPALALGLGYQLWTGEGDTRSASGAEDAYSTSSPGRRVTYVAVPPSTGDTALDAAVRGGIVRGLFDLQGIAVLPPHDVSIVTEGYEHVHGRQPDASEVAHAMGADEVIESRLACARERCQVSWKRIAHDGHTRATREFEVPRDDLVGSEQAVLANLYELYGDHARRDLGAEAGLARTDYEAYLHARNSYWADEDSIASDAMLEQLQSIQERAPESLGPYLLEFDMRHRRARWRNSNPERAQSLVPLDNAVKRAPDSYALLATQLDLALQVDELDLAREALRRIEALDPDSGWTSLLRGQRHLRIAEKEEAFAVLQRAAVPGAYWRIWLMLVMMERDRDRLGEASAYIDQLLEHSPGNYLGLSLLAQVKMRSNDPACAAELYEALVKRRRHPDVCINLGVAQTLLARYEDAAESYRCGLEARPGDALALFNYAEALVLAGATPLAGQKFRELLDILRARSTRTGLPFRLEIQALAHLARHDASLAAEVRDLTQRMLAVETSETPSLDALYTAAMAHALLGDERLAVKHVRALLDGGRPEGWIHLPWFDWVRHHPALKERLAYERPATTCKQ